MKDSKYIIGIDLGTTNSAVSYMDATEEKASPAIFPIPQVVNAGEIEYQQVLPSFTYIPGSHELPEGSLALPWDQERAYCVGEFAREQGAKVPQRMVSSAKSWLCHGGVDRNAPILPWKSPEEIEKISPVEVATRYLAHMKEAWNTVQGAAEEDRFEEQSIILTVPASFDAVARELTVQAAEEAGLRVTLLEEPQAALYNWLERLGDRWRKTLKVNDLLLVCDIGGGTTDFSLISVQEEAGDLILERIAVGDHILLGGDNMDLALAMTVQQRLKEEGAKLDNWQLQALCQACRVAKEEMLADQKMKKHPLVVAGRGSKLVGGSIKTELTRDELQNVIIEGFFPKVAPGEHPRRGVRMGLMELGLPYETDAAITRHIAGFLSAHQKSIAHHMPEKEGNEFILPSAILFNGGVLKSDAIRHRIVEVVEGWSRAGGKGSVQILEGDDLDLAVARGAAYYGMVKRGRGIRIRGGTARSYYVGLEASMPAVPGMKPPLKSLCVAPQGMEEGTEAMLPDQEFGLLVGEPAEFRFLCSSVRAADPLGALIEDWDDREIQELSPLKTALPAEGDKGSVIPVQLESHVTEVGTLEVWCVEREGERRWKLEFDIREKEEALKA